MVSFSPAQLAAVAERLPNTPNIAILLVLAVSTELASYRIVLEVLCDLLTALRCHFPARPVAAGSNNLPPYVPSTCQIPRPKTLHGFDTSLGIQK